MTTNGKKTNQIGGPKASLKDGVQVTTCLTVGSRTNEISNLRLYSRNLLIREGYDNYDKQ